MHRTTLKISARCSFGYASLLAMRDTYKNSRRFWQLLQQTEHFCRGY